MFSLRIKSIMSWKRTSRTLGLAAAGIGAVAFMGWVFGIDALKRIHPAWVAMKPNTALCLMLAGLAVVLLRDESVSGFRRRLGMGCGFIITLVGFWALGECIGWWKPSIDDVLFHGSAAEAGGSFRGRMGLASAVNFVLIGLAVLLLDVRLRRNSWPAQVCALATFTITFLNFLVYFYPVEMSARLVPYLSIAMHTVVAFLMLAAAILLARPDRGFMAVFTADNTGGLVAQRMLPAALLLPALLGWLCTIGQNAGYYGHGLQAALLATSLTLIFTSLVWWSARELESTAGQRRKAEKELLRSERELSDFFDNAVVAMHWMGPDGRALRVNKAELAMLGYTEEEYVGRPIADFHADPEVIANILARLAAGENVLAHPAQLRCKDGSLRDVFIDSSVYLEDGQFIHARCFTRDVTDFNRAEAARNRLAAIVDSSADAIVSKTLEGIVTSWNAGAERLFGYAAEEMIGQSITRIIPADLRHEEIEFLRRLREGEVIDHYETVRVAKDGHMLEVSVTISPVRDTKGAIVGAAKIARDITARKLAERELAQAHEAAEAANHAKDDFLAVLSHELRTPLTPALVAASELETAPPSDPVVLRETAALVRRNIEHQARLVDDLLDHTRIISGKLRINSVHMDLHATLRDALAIAEPTLREKNIHVTSELAAHRHLVRGEPARLAQVFSNLLTNAAKFTPEGGRVTIRTANTDDGKLRVEVSDTGIGIAPEVLAEIFEPFSQGEAGTTRRFGGLGLGLSVAKNLVKAHGGVIEARSDGHDQGATFSVTLPALDSTHLSVDESSDSAMPAAPIRSLHVLLVEDHEDTRNVIRQLITRWGHTVTTAGTVTQARGAIAVESFDLLLSDITLPDGSGLEVVAALRERSNVPAVAMSGHGMEADLTRARSAGFTDNVVKPVGTDALRELLAHVSAAPGPPGAA